MKKVLLILFISFACSCGEKHEKTYQKMEGLAFGTSFHITMDMFENQITEIAIDSLIHDFNSSLSTYIPNSDISKINRGDTTVEVDDNFQEVFQKSHMIYKETQGFFDPTIGTLVNAWGFGPEERLNRMEPSTVDSLLTYVGFEKIELKEKRLVKLYPEIYLDFNAIAKGFAVDVIGRYLESKGVLNYLVEIGGEIRARGQSPKGGPWRIGIEEPNFDGSRSFQTIINLENESIATSGSYRKFKIDSISGKKYAHTIDTQTGYPSKSNLLSASVIAKLDCADVDAYATAFMAMGFEETKKFLSSHHDLKVFLIYTGKEGELITYITDNLKPVSKN